MQFYGISFTHPYKQSDRWQDVFDTPSRIFLAKSVQKMYA